MNPIIIVDSNKEDADFLVQSLIDEGAKAGFRYFNSTAPALEYLNSTVDRPSVIISDINLPQVNGLSFKRSINDTGNLRSINIPFFFFSATKNAELIDEALCLSVQGYFQKPDNITDYDIVAKKIKKYLDDQHLRPHALIN